MAATRGLNQRPWFYSCVSFGITIPEVAIRDRMIPLYGFNSGAEGYLFWGLNYHNRFRRSSGGQSWDGYRTERGVRSLMGDGTLIYPIREGSYLSTGSKLMYCPSTRLKMFRAGMEDYEFLNHLRRLYERHKARLSDDERAQIERLLNLDTLLFYSAWEDPDLINQRRGEVGNWITRLGAGTAPAAATRER